MENMLFINIGTQEMILLFIFGVAGFVPLIFVIVALIDLFKRDFGEKTTDKILLIALILLAPIVGSLIYYFSLRKSYLIKHQTY